MSVLMVVVGCCWRRIATAVVSCARHVVVAAVVRHCRCIFVGPQPWKFSEILRKLPAAALRANGDDEDGEDGEDAGATAEKYNTR